MRSPLIAAALLLFATRWAAAQPAESSHTKTASLSWTRLEGAQGCIGTRDLAQAVETLLGHPVFVSASQAEVSIEGRAEPQSAGGYRATITVSSKSGQPLGTRELASEKGDCRALDEQVALAVALIIDPEAALAPKTAKEPERPRSGGEAEPRVIEKRVPVYVPVRVEGPAPPPRPSWRGDVFAAAAVGSGTLPDPSFAAVVGASLDPPWLLPLETVISVVAPQHASAPRSARVSFFVAHAGLFACPLAKRGEVFAARVCGGGEAGVITAVGEGFDSDGAGVRAQLAVAARARLSVKVAGPFALAAAVAGSVPLRRERFVYRDPSGAAVELFRVPAVAARGELGLELRFP